MKILAAVVMTDTAMTETKALTALTEVIVAVVVTIVKVSIAKMAAIATVAVMASMAVAMMMTTSAAPSRSIIVEVRQYDTNRSDTNNSLGVL